MSLIKRFHCIYEFDQQSLSLFAEGFGNSSYVNLKTKSTSATSELLSSISHTLSLEFDQQSHCCFTDIELPFKFGSGGDMEFRVGSAPAKSVGFSHGNKFLMLVLNLHWCVCVFDFQEVALLYK